MFKKFLIFLGILGFTYAQHNHNHAMDENGYIRCLTDELEQELQLINPEFIAERDAQLEKAKQLLRDNPQWRTDSSTQTTIYIPVVFHVLYFNS